MPLVCGSMLPIDRIGPPNRSACCSVLILLGLYVYLKYFKARIGPNPAATMSCKPVMDVRLDKREYLVRREHDLSSGKQTFFFPFFHLFFFSFSLQLRTKALNEEGLLPSIYSKETMKLIQHYVLFYEPYGASYCTVPKRIQMHRYNLTPITATTYPRKPMMI